LEQLVCAALAQDCPYPEVHRYLDGEASRLAQLSTRIAHLFEEYEYNRPSVWDATHQRWAVHGVDAHWLQGDSYFTHPPTENERWQMDLYRRIFGTGGSLGPQSHSLSLPRLHRLRHDAASNDAGQPWDPHVGHVFLFQVSQISHFHRNLLLELSQIPGSEMEVLLTNPCAEFWEDVDTSRSRKSARTRWSSQTPLEQRGIAPMSTHEYNQDHLSYDRAPDHELLRLWGRTGKESVSLWCQAVQYDFTFHAAERGEPATMLEFLQDSLLHRDDSPIPQPPEDSSLVLANAPDLGREVEAARDQILLLMQQGVIERLDEVAVYLPDPDLYLPQLHRVFGAYAPGDPGFMPYAILGGSTGDSLFAQGLRLMLSLVGGHFSRAQVFAFLRNPLVRAQLNLDLSQLEVWESWAAATGVFRGFDAAHRRQMGDEGALCSDVHTFGLGMARLLLGNLAAGPVELGYQLGLEDNRILPYRDMESSDSWLMEFFCATLERLYRDCHTLQMEVQKQNWQTAISATQRLVEDWLTPSLREAEWNVVAEARCRADFLSLLPDLLWQSTLGLRPGPADFAEFQAHVLTCLPPQWSAGSARAWSGALTFAPLRAGHILPHRAILVLGLEASVFPGTRNESPLDLLSLRRIVGDTDPVQDGRFAFLDLLQAARQHLYLSYCGEDIRKDAERPPSSLLLELQAFLRRFLGAEVPCVQMKKIPLLAYRSDESCLDPLDARLRTLEKEGPPTKAWFRLPLKHSSTPSLEQPSRSIRTTQEALRLFFRNPLEFHLARRLEMPRDNKIDSQNASDEPLSLERPLLASLQKSVILSMLQLLFPAQPGTCNEGLLRDAARKSVQQTFLDAARKGAAPEAQFADALAMQLEQWALDLVPRLAQLQISFPNHSLSLGDQGSLALPLSEGSSCLVLLRQEWTLRPRVSDPEFAIGLIAFPASGVAADNPDLWIDCSLQWLAQQKSEASIRNTAVDRATSTTTNLTAASKIVAIQINRKDGALSMQAFAPAEVDRPRRELSELLQDMLLDQNAEHLPAAALRSLKKVQGITAEALEESLASEFPPYTCYLPAFALTEARIPDDETLSILIPRRFSSFLEWGRDNG
ncbi:MAG TPA: exodeoxyribonuclease V subunit gamma, partial [Fibrobacteraceae bacterium]|nr:exodeoxyribonuclease V subunit gamma [Fibrobacteraceae bacterium]